MWLSSGVAWEWPDPAAERRSGPVAAWAAGHRPAVERVRPSYAYATLTATHINKWATPGGVAHASLLSLALTGVRVCEAQNL